MVCLLIAAVFFFFFCDTREMNPLEHWSHCTDHSFSALRLTFQAENGRVEPGLSSVLDLSRSVSSTRADERW